MKKTNFIKRALVALTFAVAVAVMIPAAGSVEAQAATKKVTATKKQAKAPKVKVGSNKVTVKLKPYTQSYVKFTAPKAGKYVFTFSNLKGKEDFTLGYLGIQKKMGKYYNYQQLSTNLGKTLLPSIASKYAMTTSTVKRHNKENKKADRYSASPKVTMSLKKGETIWIMMTGSSKPLSYSLNIKRK